MQNEITYKNSGNILEDAKSIIESSQTFAYKAVNYAIIQRNWLLGKRISEEDLHGEKRAEYGKQIKKRFLCNLRNSTARVLIQVICIGMLIFISLFQTQGLKYYSSFCSR